MEEQPPFRHRHDGLTPERQLIFTARLAETGCVRDACRSAGVSNTSAYRARRRMPDFAARWDMALAEKRPVLEQAAFERAVNGVEVGLPGKEGTVVRFRRYSDALLRFLIERDDRRDDAAKRKSWEKPQPTIEEVREEVLRRIRVVSQQHQEEERERALAFAERMRREGKAP